LRLDPCPLSAFGGKIEPKHERPIKAQIKAEIKAN
jgi:hypothetical protein